MNIKLKTDKPNDKEENGLLSLRRAELKAIYQKLCDNPRVVAIRVATPADCPIADHIQGVYPKGAAPELPMESCARVGGCICAYEPVLKEIYP